MRNISGIWSRKAASAAMELKSSLLLGCSALAAASSTAVFRYSLKDRFAWNGSFSQLFFDLLGLLRNAGFLLGLLIFVIANVLWLLVLGSQKLSLAYPIQLGSVLAINALISVLVFKETVSPTAWVGIVFVGIGIFLITK
jgi:multidrug transporter EmrE-like cation transporter